MKMNTERTALILLGTLGGAALITGAVCMIRHSKQYKAMRAVRRTNAVLRRVGHVLSSVAEASGECL